MSTKFELCTCKMSDETLKWNNIHTFVCAHYITYTTKIIKLYYFPQITFKRPICIDINKMCKRFFKQIKVLYDYGWKLALDLASSLFKITWGRENRGNMANIHFMAPWAWQEIFYSMMQRALMMHPLRMTINKIKFATSSEEECYHTLYKIYKYIIWIFEDTNFRFWRWKFETSLYSLYWQPKK